MYTYDGHWRVIKQGTRIVFRFRRTESWIYIAQILWALNDPEKSVSAVPSRSAH